jgi:hypothetical protein
MGRLTIASWLCLTVCGAAVVEAAAQSVPSKRETSELVFKARQQWYLTAKDAPPFHIVASFRYVYGAIVKNGTYELLWADPERFREEFRLGDDIGETDLAMEGKLYVNRNTKFLSYPLWRVREMMFLPVTPAWAKFEKAIPVHSIKQEGPNLLTVEMDSQSGSDRVRLDFPSNKILSEETKMERGRFKKSSLDDSFVDFGGARYPRHFLFHLKDETVEINVSKLENADSFGDSVFVPPANATSRDWCADPTTRIERLPGTYGANGQLRTGLLIQDFHFPEGPQSALYYLVGPDGHVELLASLNADATATEGSPDKMLNSKTRLPVRTCSGKPIEYELVTQIVAINP